MQTLKRVVKSLVLLACLGVTLQSTSSSEVKQKADNASITENVSGSKVNLSEEDRGFSIYLNPLLKFISYVNIQGNVKLNDKWSIGLEYASSSFGSDTTNLSARILGLNTEYYFGNGEVFKDSWYGKIGLYVSQSVLDLSFFKIKTRELLLGGAFGHQWVWDRFFVKLGVGFSPTSPILDTQLGVVF